MSQSDSQIPNFPDNVSCVFDRAAIDAALDQLAAELNAAMADTHPIVMPVLHGGLILSGHLLTRLNFPLHQDYIHASRYRGAQVGGETLHWLAKPQSDLKGRTVLLLDDIFDQGYTLEAIQGWLLEQGVAEVKSAVLLSKRHVRPMSDYRPDFSALEVDDRYVFGFGMDYEHAWRNANGIYALDNG